MIGAAAVAVHDRDVEPGPLREQFEIALRIALKLREPEQKGGRRHPDRQAGQRLRAARQIRLLHQESGHAADAAEGKIDGQRELVDFNMIVVSLLWAGSSVRLT